MSAEQFVHALVEFVRANEGAELPIVALLAFGESLAVVSLFVPATVALIGIGALVGLSDIDFAPVWIAASVGAILGDWLSYSLGARFKEPITSMWPLSRYPDLVPTAEAFIHRWGVAAAFIGRFLGPARSAVPLAAGILHMPYWRFQIANVLSAFIWAAVLLAPGTVALRWAGFVVH